MQEDNSLEFSNEVFERQLEEFRAVVDTYCKTVDEVMEMEDGNG